MKKVKYGIIGANGFTGQELFTLASLDERLECVFQATSKDLIDKTLLSKNPDIVFFATPHGVCMQYASLFLEAGVKIIDLSGDFRFKNPNIFEKAYKMPHTSANQKAIFGLTELMVHEIVDAPLVANPGCYVTASLLALLPLEKYFEKIIIDGKSGYSGAGKDFANHKLLEENSCIPYSLTKHRHEAEMQQFFSCSLSFTPHLINTFRGMLVTIHAFIKPEFHHLNFFKLLSDQYQAAPLITVQKTIPTISDVQHTSRCVMGGFEMDENGRLVIISVIDNLRKGASSQALQNMYAMFSLLPPNDF